MPGSSLSGGHRSPGSLPAAPLGGAVHREVLPATAARAVPAGRCSHVAPPPRIPMVTAALRGAAGSGAPGGW